jgi:hypothetical protein
VSAEEVLGRLRDHLDAPRQRPLIALFGELMSIVAGPSTAPDGTKPETIKAPPATTPSPGSSAVKPRGPDATRDWVPARTRTESGEVAHAGGGVRLTHRTRQVLESLRAHPGESNRGLARRAGGVDAGQISKLLRRLEDRGLIANHGEVEYSWSANSWFLTDLGRDLLDR